MPAVVFFDFGSNNTDKVILVPVHSVGEDGTGNFVYLVNKTGNGLGIVEKTKVTIGKMTADGFEVIDGVKAGDMVVTAGISHLSNKLEVRIQ